MAKKYFGNSQALGETLFLYIGTKRQYIVSGVVESHNDNSNMNFNIVFPIAPVYKDRNEKDDWYHHSIDTYVLTVSGISKDSLDSSLTRLIRKYMKEDPQIEIKTQKLTEIHLKSPAGIATGMQYIVIFSITAFFILIIAAINYTNLSIAIATGRMREVGLKKVFGSTRYDLVKLFLSEAFIQSFLAFLLALALCEILLPMFRELSGKELTINYFSIYNILFAFGLITFTTVLSGAFPAFYTSSFQPATVFKGASFTTKDKLMLRKILVVVQFTIAVTLLIATVVIFSQLNYIQNKNLGFDKENLVFLPYPDEIAKKYGAFKNDLLADPSILSVCRSSENPAYVYNRMGGLEWEGKDENTVGRFKFLSVDADFFRTMKISIVDGREFSDEIKTDSANYIFNEAAAKVLGFSNPVGRNFAIDSTTSGKIIGIVKNFNTQPLNQEIEPLMVLHWPDWYWTILVRIQHGNPGQALEHIEKIWKQFAPSSPYEYGFLDNFIQKRYESEKRMGKLAVVFSVLVLLITAIGLFSLASFSAQQRTKEAGIRKVLGASSFEMIEMFTASFLKWVAIANIIAWPVAWYFSEKWLQGFAFRVEINLLIFPLVSSFTILLAIITISYQTWRMSNLNPAESLRHIF